MRGGVMLNDDEKLHAEILKGDLEAYRKLETWGSSLFLGAIGIIAKQLVEWDITAHIALSATMTTLPAVVGLTAFLFLRVVNTRSYKTGLELRTMAGVLDRGLKESFGILGFMLAIMPLLFGTAVSWLLTDGVPERICCIRWIIFLDCIAFLGAVGYHFWLRAVKSS